MVKKFNLIDWLIILVIVTLAALGVYKITNTQNLDQSVSATVIYQAKNQNLGLANAVKEGQKLFDSITETEIGTVRAIEILPHKELVTNGFNKTEYVEIPDKYDVNISVSSSMNNQKTGYSINGKRILIGATLRLKSVQYVFDGEIIDITDVVKTNHY